MQVESRVQEIKSVAIRITKAGMQRRERLAKHRVCLVCEEPIKGPTRRGCCAACRMYAQRLIDRGERSEESLIREGYLLEAGRSCGKKPHPKREALRRRSKSLAR